MLLYAQEQWLMEPKLVLINPGSDRTVGGTFTKENFDSLPLEEQIAQQSDLVLLHSAINTKMVQHFTDEFNTRKGLAPSISTPAPAWLTAAGGAQPTRPKALIRRLNSIDPLLNESIPPIILSCFTEEEVTRITALKKTLEKEINSFFAFNKSRKREKIEVLKKLLETSPEDQLRRPLLLSMMKNSEAQKGVFSDRTKQLLQDLLRNTPQENSDLESGFSQGPK